MFMRLTLTILIGSLLVSSACKQTPFEATHDRAVRENPPGVDLRIAIGGGRNQFRTSEPVQVEEFYTAKYPGQWHLEILDNWNEASISDEARVSDGKTVRLLSSFLICCDSRHVWLSQDAVRLPYSYRIRTLEGYKPPSTRVIRFEKPGQYEFYVTTQRVFSRDQQTTTYSGLGYGVTSENVLKLEIGH